MFYNLEKIPSRWKINPVCLPKSKMITISHFQQPQKKNQYLYRWNWNVWNWILFSYSLRFNTGCFHFVFRLKTITWSSYISGKVFILSFFFRIKKNLQYTINPLWCHSSCQVDPIVFRHVRMEQQGENSVSSGIQEFFSLVWAKVSGLIPSFVIVVSWNSAISVCFTWRYEYGWKKTTRKLFEYG